MLLQRVPEVVAPVHRHVFAIEELVFDDCLCGIMHLHDGSISPIQSTVVSGLPDAPKGDDSI